MTGWERFESVLKGEIPDSVPITHTWGDHAVFMLQWIVQKGYSGSDIEKYLQYKRDAGFALGVPVTWFDSLPRGEHTASDGSTHYTSWGGLEPGSSLRPYEEVGDLEQFRVQVRDAVALNGKYGLGTRGFITNCFHSAAISLGLERFAVGLFEQPEWIRELMELVERHNRRGLQVMVEEGADIVLFDGDCAFKNGPMVSPEMMRTFWFDLTRDTVDLLHEAGVWAYYHTDGKVDKILPMLIELRFAAFHGCEKMANDLQALKTQFGDRITLIGNADHSELTFWKPDEIRIETEKMMAAGKPGGRFMADVNTAMPQCSVENYRAFYETVMACSG